MVIHQTAANSKAVKTDGRRGVVRDIDFDITGVKRGDAQRLFFSRWNSIGAAAYARPACRPASENETKKLRFENNPKCAPTNSALGNVSFCGTNQTYEKFVSLIGDKILTFGEYVI